MKKQIEKMEFEESIAELEKIISVLGEGNLSLREASDLYTRGIHLRNHCKKILEEIELKLSQISPNDDGYVNITEKREVEL
ncbi:MAG: exodeoxyribonuclease VII small subunit [Alphaproteobacteria bacterium]|nr:exodeoxyribonuclease VII small subunit [Alphaproteobacteria bacterium]